MDMKLPDVVKEGTTPTLRSMLESTTLPTAMPHLYLLANLEREEDAT
jgi:hypothetical protein